MMSTTAVKPNSALAKKTGWRQVKFGDLAKYVITPTG